TPPPEVAPEVARETPSVLPAPETMEAAAEMVAASGLLQNAPERREAATAEIQRWYEDGGWPEVRRRTSDKVTELVQATINTPGAPEVREGDLAQWRDFLQQVEQTIERQPGTPWAHAN